jgi:uncharacterized protein YidB (DUF937 family)
VGLFDKVVGAVSGGGEGGGLAQLLMGALANHEGGINGVVEKFQSAGLGGVLASWVGTGENQPITPAALETVFSPEMIQGLADKTGLPVQQLLHEVSQYLPQLVDNLTPNGEIPSGGGWLEAGLSMLKGRFGTPA